MAAPITSCSTAILAASSILQIVLRIIEIFTSTCAEYFTRKWWHWSIIEVWNFTIKTFKTYEFNESSFFICRFESELDCSVKEDKGAFCEWCFKNIGIEILILYVENRLLIALLLKFLATHLVWPDRKLNRQPNSFGGACTTNCTI